MLINILIGRVGLSDPRVCYTKLQIYDHRHLWSDVSYLQMALDALAQEYVPPVHPEIEAKQKRIERLLLILALVRIKRHLERLFLIAAFVFHIPEQMAVKPTRSARITPFIYFP